MIISQIEFHKLYGSGRPAIPEAFRDNNIKPEIEIPILTALVDHCGAKRCLEIGCNTGATSAAILAGNSTITAYIGVDLDQIWYTAQLPGQFALVDPRFRLMQLENGSKDLHPGDIEPVDFVFIDGDHSFPWVAWDSKLARSLLSPAGGIIAWHDYGHPTCPDVKRFIHEENDRNFIADNHEPRIVWVQGTTICYQIIAALPAATVEVKSDEPKRKRRIKPTEPANSSATA